MKRLAIIIVALFVAINAYAGGSLVQPIVYSDRAVKVQTADWNAWVSLSNTKVVSKTTTYTATTSEGIILCSGTFTVTLPTAVGIQGKMFNIKNTGTGTITIDGDGTETIDGELTQELGVQYDSVTLTSNGSNWFIL